MANREHDESIEEEPHFRDAPHAGDPSEPSVEEQMAAERARTDPAEERATHSVFDEPGTVLNRAPALIEQNWLCRQCSYNLRGLMTGHPCPECGSVERYEPPRPGEVTYSQWLQEHRTRSHPARSWLLVVAMPLFALPGALACSALIFEATGFLPFVIIGPAASELAKIAGALTIVERRHTPLRSRFQLYAMTIGTALIFAAVQNLIYLKVFTTATPVEVTAFRWTVGMSLHALCTGVATHGLASVWAATAIDGRKAKLTSAIRWLVVSITLHAVFNGIVFSRGWAGYGF